MSYSKAAEHWVGLAPYPSYCHASWQQKIANNCVILFTSSYDLRRTSSVHRPFSTLPTLPLSVPEAFTVSSLGCLPGAAKIDWTRRSPRPLTRVNPVPDPPLPSTSHCSLYAILHSCHKWPSQVGRSESGRVSWAHWPRSSGDAKREASGLSLRTQETVFLEFKPI